jgi:hypothetical protein
MRSKLIALRVALLLLLTAGLIAATAVAALAQRSSWVV